MQDVFVRNWQTGHVELVSTSPLGEQSNCDTGQVASISEDGRFVVFVSCASNLTTDNPQSVRNLFLRDRWFGTTRRLTWPWLGGEFITSPTFVIERGGSRIVAGRYLAFWSISSELVAGVGSIHPNAYVLDILTGELELISQSWDGSPNLLGGERAAISGDGRYVAFSSRSNSILPGGSMPGVFVRDRMTGEIVSASASLPYLHVTDLPQVHLSGDGSTLAYTWRYSTDAPVPYTGRTLIYTVSISGTPIELPEPEPVPSASALTRWLASVALLMAGLASLSLRRRRAH